MALPMSLAPEIIQEIQLTSALLGALMRGRIDRGVKPGDAVNSARSERDLAVNAAKGLMRVLREDYPNERDGMRIMAVTPMYCAVVAALVARGLSASESLHQASQQRDHFFKAAGSVISQTLEGHGANGPDAELQIPDLAPALGAKLRQQAALLGGADASSPVSTRRGYTTR